MGRRHSPSSRLEHRWGYCILMSLRGGFSFCFSMLGYVLRVEVGYDLGQYDRGGSFCTPLLPSRAGRRLGFPNALKRHKTNRKCHN